jgi:hypothetical protein
MEHNCLRRYLNPVVKQQQRCRLQTTPGCDKQMLEETKRGLRHRQSIECITAARCVRRRGNDSFDEVRALPDCCEVPISPEWATPGDAGDAWS